MLNSIDLFAGCGGLCDGFEQSRKYVTLGAVEWEKAPAKQLRKRLKNKWNISDADYRVLCFDMQRTEELLNGWSDDEKFGCHMGLDACVGDKTIDVIIGGPPCQAYSIAGRVRDEKGMKEDYRNYLFESYLEVVKHYKPKAFVFENVPGILSAKPGDGSFLIIDKIKEEFNKAGYHVLNDLSRAEIDMTEYGVPQNRNRIIILGLSNQEYGDLTDNMLEKFYIDILPSFKEEIHTVRDAISDLPCLMPLKEDVRINGRHLSHSLCNPPVNGHIPRFHSLRDIEIFKLLAEDIESGRREYTSTAALKKLYTEKTGKTSNVHKYHVCEWDKPSNLIPAHLYKDGLRHIHPDPKQARTLTVREAARLQTFDDDFEFGDSATDAYKMIGNAVPPKFACKVALAVAKLLEEGRDK
jgi:DNA (cytosine-5)-methyltransferase 1